MEIAQNRAVALDYRVSLTNGITVDASSDTSPLWYVHGRNNLLPAFENHLEGLKVGDHKSFRLAAKDAYGETKPELVINVDKWQLAQSGKCFPGETVTVRNKGGQEAQGRIVSVEKDSCKVDLNHQLAGQDLDFQIEVKVVRPASSKELVHGQVILHEEKHEHVHGVDCQHDHH